MKMLPSILTANFLNLKQDINCFIKAGIDEIHLDIMDGNFVDAITFGPKLVADIHREYNNLKLDVHLMIKNPDKHIQNFLDAGSDVISIHCEECSITKIVNIAKQVHEQNKKIGIAINPATNVKKLNTILKRIPSIDIILIMSVVPGAGGQKFNEEVLKKATYLNEIKNKFGYNFELEIDGGVKTSNYSKIVSYDINRLVVGSALYENNKIEENIARFK